MITKLCFILLTSMSGSPLAVNPSYASYIETRGGGSYFYMGDGYPNWEVREPVEVVYEKIKECTAE